MNYYFRRETCAVCDSQIKKVMALNPTPICDAFVSASFVDKSQEIYPIDLFFCENCGLLQIPDIIAPEILYKDYIYETSSSMGLSSHFKVYADEIITNIVTKGDLVIDIGCNDATLLKYFKACGRKVIGVEPATEISEKVRQSGITCYTEFFSVDVAKKIQVGHGPASVVTANNVFANIVNLNEFLQGVRHLLADDGVFVVETGAGLDVMMNLMLDTVAHEHIYYFNVKPLQYLCEQNGLEVVDVRAISSKGGSLHAVVQLKGGPRPVASSVSKRRLYEQALGFEQIDIYKSLAAKFEVLRKELIGILDDIKMKDQSVAVYGAAAGVTNLLYFFDINDRVDYLIDDNAQRQKLFSPGHHIPVVSPQTIYEKKPDYILVLAWRYAQPIISRHHEFIRAGGKFIVPLPKIQIVSDVTYVLDDLCKP